MNFLLIPSESVDFSQRSAAVSETRPGSECSKIWLTSGDGQQTKLNPKPPFQSKSLNWDMMNTDMSTRALPTLNPRDVLQVAFLVEQEEGQNEGLEALQKDLRRDGRATLGQLSIEWRGAMGDKGFLTTGNLMSRKRT
jgi:hypothetical protein